MLRSNSQGHLEYRAIEGLLRTAAPHALTPERREALRLRVMRALGEQDPGRSTPLLGHRWIAIPVGAGIAATIVAASQPVLRDILHGDSETGGETHIDVGGGTFVIRAGETARTTGYATLLFRDHDARVDLEANSELRVVDDDGTLSLELVEGTATVASDGEAFRVFGAGWEGSYPQGGLAAFRAGESALITTYEGVGVVLAGGVSCDAVAGSQVIATGSTCIIVPGNAGAPSPATPSIRGSGSQGGQAPSENNPPGHGGTPPGHGGTPPGQGDTPPGQGDTPPGQGGTPPGQGGTPSGQGGTPPGQSGTPPEQGGTPPGQGASTPPGQSGTPPGQGASTPPGQSGTPPGQGSTPPGQGKTPPGQGTGTPPDGGETPPDQQGGGSPRNGGTQPGQGGSSSGNGGSRPGQGGSSPGNGGSQPGQGGSPSGNGGTQPGQQGGSSPGNSGSAPGQDDGSPGNSDTAPGQDDGSPGNSGSAPGQQGGPGNGKGPN